MFFDPYFYLKIALAVCVYFISRVLLRRHKQKTGLEANIKRRKLEREENFAWAEANFEKLDENLARNILGLSFDELRDSLQNGKIQPTEALRAYQRRAFEADRTTNCVCLFIVESIDIAKKLEIAAENPKYQKPPLFGVPVSIKESIKVKNMDSTKGYAKHLFEPSAEHSTSVEQLIRLGAIPFVHTNIPQALLSFGCCNPIYGATSNPWDARRVPGGSSGGEAALVALGGSPLGIGTDVGGSVRTPATYCGLAAFKSSAMRTPQTGKVASIPGRQLLQSVEGPIAPTIDVCVEYLKLKWNDEKLFKKDIYMSPVKFRNEHFESTNKLRIGYYTFDGYQEAPPVYQRAVLDTVAALQNLGHELVQFDVPRPHDMFSVFCAGASADGGIYLNRSLDEDIVPADCRIGFPVTKLPYFIQKLFRKYLPFARVRSILQELPHNCEEMREMHEKIENYRHEFVVEMNRKRLDALVCPAFGCLPPRHGMPNKIISATSYTALFNLLDFAAGTVPVTRVTQKDDVETGKMGGADQWDRMIRSESMNCQGLPASVQIAARPFDEEMCLRLLKSVEKSIGLQRK